MVGGHRIGTVQPADARLDAPFDESGIARRDEAKLPSTRLNAFILQPIRVKLPVSFQKEVADWDNDRLQAKHTD